MFERITGAIDARPFAVPDTEHAIDRFMRIRFDLLGA